MSVRRRGRDLNPRRTLQHVRDFQSRSLDRSDTSPRRPSVSPSLGGSRSPPRRTGTIRTWPDRSSSPAPPGFIGSNFVRWWLERHPDDHVVALDQLTYAGDPREPRRARRRGFVEGDIGDLELAERAARRGGDRRRSSTSPPSRTTASPSSIPAASSAPTSLGTQTLLEAARRHGRRRASTTSRPARSTATCRSTPTRRSPRSRRTGRGRRTTRRRPAADHAVRAYSETFGLPVTITNCSNNYGPYQFPEKVIPLFVDARARRPGAAALRVDAEPARVAARRRPLPRDRARARARARRRDVQRRLGRRASRSRRSPTSCSS